MAGDADILLGLHLGGGNILAKQLTDLADADAAGIVLGARVPIILTSRADTAKARLGVLRRSGCNGLLPSQRNESGKRGGGR